DAGLERASFTGVHDHLDLGIGIELQPRVAELVAHVAAHRVELLRPVVDQPAHRAVALHDQGVELRERHDSSNWVVSHWASRFSANASGPSVWSGCPHTATSSCAPARQASVSPCSSAPHNAFLVARIAAGEFLATFSASSCAASRSPSGGSTT